MINIEIKYDSFEEHSYTFQRQKLFVNNSLIGRMTYCDLGQDIHTVGIVGLDSQYKGKGIYVEALFDFVRKFKAVQSLNANTNARKAWNKIKINLPDDMLLIANEQVYTAHYILKLK